MTQLVILIFIIIASLIATSNGQAQFCNAICYEGTPTNGATGYLSTVNSFGATITPSITIATTPTCNAATYTGTSGSCFDCCFTIDTLSEDERWRLLYAVNTNLGTTFATNLGSTVGQNVTSIRYARADAVTVDSNCADLSYPRICRLSLSQVSDQGSIEDPYFLSIALNITSTIATFRAGYSVSNDWFGFAFSTNVPPLPMTGYALVWSSGPNGLDTPQFQEYDLAGSTSIVKQSTQNLNLIGSADVNGITTYEFTRVFNTGNGNDFVFTGNENNLTIFAAVTGPTGSALLGHSSTNLVRATGKDYTFSFDLF